MSSSDPTAPPFAPGQMQYPPALPGMPPIPGAPLLPGATAMPVPPAPPDVSAPPPAAPPEPASSAGESGPASDELEAPPEPSFVYAVGKIEPRFPSLGVEKEFAQVVGRADSAGLTDRQAAQAVLSERQNRYLVRQLTWVLTIEGVETFLLVPRDPFDLELLVDARSRRRTLLAGWQSRWSRTSRSTHSTSTRW
jgi:hypothetical protein